MTHRPLEEILAELGEVQDRLIEIDPDDFVTRADLSNRQDALRLEAKQARAGIPTDAMGVEQLEREIAHLEDELARYLDARPSASAGGPSGGYGGGGIDPNELHEMHRKMDASFGFAEKKARLNELKNAAGGIAVDERPSEPTGLASQPAPPRRSRFLVPAAGFVVLTALVVAAVLLAPDGSPDSPSTTLPSIGEVLVPSEAAVLVTHGERVTMLDAQGKGLAEVRGAAGDAALNRHPADAAFSDLDSGLIYREATGWQIRHWPDPEASARTVVGGGERGVQLFDVARVEGRPMIMAGLHLDDAGADWTQLAFVDVETFETTPIAEFGRVAEERDPQLDITAASYAQESILVTVRRDGQSWFELFNPDGARIDVGLPYWEDNTGLVGHGVLSLDGERMAYLDSATIIVRDLATRGVIGRWPLDSGFHRVERLDYDGTLLVVSFDDQSEPILINTTTQAITTLPAVGVATLIDR